MKCIETARLWLRPLTLDDAPAIQRQFPVWEIVRWLDAAVPWPYPQDGALTFMSKVALPRTASGEGWFWSIRPKTSPDELIGQITLMDVEDDNRVFWLSPAWWGAGFMTEACDAVTDFWFEELGRPLLRVHKAADNLASRRISERQGMREVRSFPKTLVSGEHLSELWEISRDEWRERRSKKEAG
jgi:ribosomal-protein-alanine N-acetyltransferase